MREKSLLLRYGRIAALTAVLLLARGGLPLRAAADEQDVGEKVVAELRLLCTRQWKGVFGETSQCASSGANLAIGETGAAYVAEGGFDEQGLPTDYGTASGGVGPLSDQQKEETVATLMTRAPHLWWVEFERRPAEIGTIAVDVTWTHYRAERRGDVEVVTRERRAIRFEEGQRHVLDFLAKTPPYKSSPNVVVEVTARVAEDPRFANERLSYDLWYRHTTAAGDVTEKHVDLAGRQGERLDFGFEALRFPVDPEDLTGREGQPLDFELPADVTVESMLEISGSIQGRVRFDGSIDIRLGAGRWIDAELAGTPRRGGIGDGGEKIVTVRPGETISLVLPEPGEVHPNGRCCVTIDDSWHGLLFGSKPVEGQPRETACVHNAAFYSGHKDELILTVTSLD